MEIVGIDVGGSGIKGARVDTATGKLLTERHRIKTPKPATPAAVATTVAQVVAASDVGAAGSPGPIGVGFPVALRDGLALTATNIDDSFVGADVATLFSQSCGRPAFALNDADAAGLGEAHFGAARDIAGTVVLITIGTGLGSSLVVDGKLVPNTELGHLRFHESIAEAYASDSVRKRLDLDWETWGRRFNEYLRHLDFVLHPRRIVLGGGGSKKWHKFEHLLDVDCEVVPAVLGNEAGIIGAAIWAECESAQRG